jgi:REP-associated tyrosine transposase
MNASLSWQMINNNNSDSHINNRHSIRFKGYDYSLEGAYFVTIATHRHECLFGKIVDGIIQLNDYGRLAFSEWTRLDKRFHPSDFSVVTIMPNHVHGIIRISRGAGKDNDINLNIRSTLRPYKIAK